MAEHQDKSESSDDDKLAALESELQQAAKKQAEQPAEPESKSEPESKLEPKETEAKPPRQTASTAPATTATAIKTDSRHSHRGLWFVSVLNLLLLVALAGGGYWFWQQQGQQQAQLQFKEQEYQNKLDAVVSSSEQAQRQIEQQNAALQQEIDTLQRSYQSANQQLQATRQQLTELSGRRPADWLLAEADYLVKMAGRKLWLEHDVQTSLLMLQSADSRLEDLADPSLLPVRQLLADDIQTLKQINPVSLSSVALSLSGLVQQVKNLPLDTIKLPESVEPKQDNELSDSVDDWQTNLRKTWNRILGDFVTVTRRDAPVQPYMSEQQQWLAREQLKQALLQAQAAVLREQTTLYQQSLQLAVASLVEQFDMSEPAVQQFVAGVQNLAETNIEKVYPPSFKVSEPLADVISARTNQLFSNGASSL